MIWLRPFVLVLMLLAALPLGALRVAAGVPTPVAAGTVSATALPAAQTRIAVMRPHCRIATLPGQPCTADRGVLPAPVAIAPPGSQRNAIPISALATAGRVVPIPLPPPRPV